MKKKSKKLKQIKMATAEELLLEAWREIEKASLELTEGTEELVDKIITERDRDGIFTAREKALTGYAACQEKIRDKLYRP